MTINYTRIKIIVGRLVLSKKSYTIVGVIKFEFEICHLNNKFIRHKNVCWHKLGKWILDE